jgi:hypothetical protein
VRQVSVLQHAYKLAVGKGAAWLVLGPYTDVHGTNCCQLQQWTMGPVVSRQHCADKE